MRHTSFNIRALVANCSLAAFAAGSYAQPARTVQSFLTQPDISPVFRSGQFRSLYAVPVSVELPDAFCGTDVDSPEARANVRAYLSARRAGRPVRASKISSPPDVGDERSFNVNENSWVPKDFRLVDKTAKYYLWVNIPELDNGNVTDSEVNALRDVILTQTPSASINPNQGIFLNNEDIFGHPPDFDGDGIVDILMYDIGAGSGGTLGYVSSADVLPGASGNLGNQADVLYLDSNEGTRNLSTLSVITAHEYTHLLHLSSGWDITLITEGYAEYAMVMNGFFWRGIDYLNSAAEYVLPLFSWRSTPKNGGPNARDYQRGGLFFTYVAEQVGPAMVGRMLQEPVRKGGNGLDSLLQLDGTSLAAILKDFHTANFLNDRSIAPEFGYIAVPRQNLRAVLTRRIDGEQLNNSAEPSFSTEVPEDQLSGGAVKYVTWDNVSDFRFSLDALGWNSFPSGIRDQIRLLMQSRVHARFMGIMTDGTAEFYDVQASDTETYRFAKSYSSLTMFLLQTDPEIPVGKVTYVADWTPLSQALVTSTEEDDLLPVGVSLDQNYPNPFSSRAGIWFDLDRTADVRLEVFDILGRSVMVLVNNRLSRGRHSVSVDAGMLSPATYFYRLDTGLSSITRRMIVAR
jgi:Secretion system C-terminal sorting domain